MQVDGGADRTITPHHKLVHGLHPPNPSVDEKTHINDAGVHPHKIVGYGYFHVKCLDSNSNTVIVKVPCAYIPLIPSTLLNFCTVPGLLHVHENSDMVLNVGCAILIIGNENDITKLTVPLYIGHVCMLIMSWLVMSNDSDCFSSCALHINHDSKL